MLMVDTSNICIDMSLTENEISDALSISSVQWLKKQKHSWSTKSFDNTHPSMASSIFFFLSSISSGVSMPAGTDEKPPGVISPLKHTK